MTKAPPASSEDSESPEGSESRHPKARLRTATVHLDKVFTLWQALPLGRPSGWRVGSLMLSGVILLGSGVLLANLSLNPELEQLRVDNSSLSADNTRLSSNAKSEAERADESAEELYDMQSSQRERDNAAKSREDAVAIAEQDVADAEAAVATRETAVGTAEEQKKKQEIRNGVHVIGTTVEPGVYSTTGPSSGGIGMCYYAWKSGTGSDASIVENNITEGAATVTVNAGDIFESTSCSTWTKVG